MLNLVLWTFLETDMAISFQYTTSTKAIWSHPCITHLRRASYRPTFRIRHADNSNSTGIRQKWKQSAPRYSTNLRRIMWVGSPDNRRWKNIWLKIRRQFDVEFASTLDRTHIPNLHSMMRRADWDRWWLWRWGSSFPQRHQSLFGAAFGDSPLII
jgi:hypothetical protein